jgi:uncharacterized protein with HEPN domain
MSRDYILFLEDMEASCKKLLAYTKGLTLNQFIEDEKTFDAVIYNLVILGEASKHMPQLMRERYPEVDWRAIAGLRDISVSSSQAFFSRGTMHICIQPV